MAIEPAGAPAAAPCPETNNNNNNNHDNNNHDNMAADPKAAALPNGAGRPRQAPGDESRPEPGSSCSSTASSRLESEASASVLIADDQSQLAPNTQTTPNQASNSSSTNANQQAHNTCPAGAPARSTTGDQARTKLSSAAKLGPHQAPAGAHPTALQQDQEAPFALGEPAKSQARRLSFLQGLLLRKWPYLALSICIMSSLLFGMLLSALTVYLMHSWGAGQCGQALALAGEGPAAAHPHHAHQLHESLMLDMMGAAGREFAGAHLSGGAPGPAAGRAAGPPLASLDAELSGRSMAGGAAEHHLSSLGAAGHHQHLEGAHPAVGAAPAGQQHQAEGAGKPRFQRLAALLEPEHYDLFVWPVIGAPAFNFTGRVAIRIRCREPTDNITLHSLDLDIGDQSVRLELLADGDADADADTDHQQLAANQSAPAVKRLSQDRQLQYSIVHLEAPLQAGRRYRLSMDFAGPLNDDLAGFYKIKYEHPNSSEPTWIAATQFQATDARRAFPCFDEPLYKATFSIKIKHWKNMTALSNMPIINSQESQDGLWITDTFAKTHRMSTYLVAYAVTNFESRTNGNISVWTRPGIAHTAEYALKIAGKILRHYENFFGIEYPLPKMDMIALPDFNAGAMENWGLITYRETAMLFDESSSSVVNKQRVATVVAHELAHQWFGNLVTPKWWDDLWLNEGFASYVEYIGVDHVEPHWRMLDQFVVDEIQDVLKVDCLSSSHQISIPVNNPDEISEIFDHISYSKGASIIRMMNHFLTEQVFKLGLQRYLRALKYDNAEQKDLWAHLTDAQRLLANSSGLASGLGPRVEMVNVENVMNSWTLQTGFPMVTLTRSYGDANSSAGKATLDQVRFQPLKVVQNQSGRNGTNSATGLQTTDAKPIKWEIPITYTWKSDNNWQPITRLWLHQNDTYPVELIDHTKSTSIGEQLKQSAIPNDDWILLNVQQVGYYRVNYDQRNWQLLINQLQQDHTKIPTINRAQILDDLFDLVKSSMLDYRFALEATRYLKNEHDYLPWRSVLLSFSYIDDMLRRTPIYGEWNEYVRKLIEPFYNRYKDLDWTVGEPASAGRMLEAAKPRLRRQVVVASNASAPSAPTMDSNDVLEQYNQMNAITWACQVDQRCIGKAKRVFREWRETKQNRIIPALRYAAYCAAIENGDKDDWEFLWHVYEKEQNASEKDRILRALGCSKEIWILSRYVEWIFDKSKPIRRQDGSFVFRMIAGNNYGRDIAFNYMREKWSTIKEYYGKTSFSMSALIRSVSTTMNTQVELNELQHFYESIKSDVGTGKRSFQLAIEEVEGNVYWRNNNYKKLEDWLRIENRSLKSASN